MKNSTLLFVFLIGFYPVISLSVPLEHQHGEKFHSHELPKPEGIKHKHGNLPYGIYSKKNKINNNSNSNSNSNNKKIKQKHVHGNIFHSHVLPYEKYNHKHGSNIVGRKFIEIKDFPYKNSKNYPFISEERIDMCLISFGIKDGLSSKFNPYADWGGNCNDFKNTKLFRDRAYKQYGEGGVFFYKRFEQDYARLLNMNVKDYVNVKTRSTRDFTSTTGGRCHSVGGYYRKSGTYVRGYTRCR